MQFRQIIEQSIERFSAANFSDPKFLLVDHATYFELKLEEYGSEDLAIAMELDTFLGLQVFYNHLDYQFIDVA